MEDVDDLDPHSIHQMLVKTKVIREKRKKSKDWVVPEEIECERSVYLFSREGIFRRSCFYIQ